MTSRFENEWSDSEDENLSEVLLGVPDGKIEESADLFDPAVSRIGGLPIFLPSRSLSSSSSHCKSCSHPMPLLVQMWCPFEGSAMDRVLYVWGCDRPECQRKAGSVRAWRGFKFNRKYAAKLEKKKAREAENAARKAAEAVLKAEAKKRQSVNPFSGGETVKMTSGLGTQLFGGPVPSSLQDHRDEAETVSESGSEESSSEDAVNRTAEQLKSTSLQPSAIPADWSSSPSYNPVYLSTVSEYIPPTPKSKKHSHDFPDDDVDNKKTSQDWGLEGWEASGDMDAVFERFVRRVSHENEQCVRYDLNGTPMPFGSRDAVYNRLFPSPTLTTFTTKPGFAGPINQRRTFNSESLDKCEGCGGRRVFECQLMPNLINVLCEQRKALNDFGRDEERKEQQPLEAVLKAEMGWGSCFIFSCLENCCADGEEEGWREELVLVQWDD